MHLKRLVKKMDKCNILIVGVGGQGTLLTSRIMGTLAMKKSYDVKVSEVHGMSQRGGSVVTCVKFGKNVNSPLIEKGEADVILAFELLEAFRWIEYIKKYGKIIINEQQIDPMPVIMRKQEYPAGVLEKIKSPDIDVFSTDALSIAKKCGNIKAVNTVLLGILAKTMNIEKDLWLESMKENIRDKYIDVNMKSFDAGYNLY